MNKEEEKEGFIIDADVVIDMYNEKNPTLRKMSQGHLAELCGVSAQRLSDWKRGQTVNAIQVIMTMSEIAGCPVETFIKTLSQKEIDDEIKRLADDENARIKHHSKK